MDNLISKYQKQIDLMLEYRTSLISQAVTGKIDVREWQQKSNKNSMRFDSQLEESFYRRFTELNLKFITSKKAYDIRLTKYIKGMCLMTSRLKYQIGQ